MSDHVSSPTKTTHDSRGPGILERTNACARRLRLDRTFHYDLPAVANDTPVGLSWSTFLPLPSSGGKTRQ